MTTPEPEADRWAQLGDAAHKSLAVVQRFLEPDRGEPEPDKKPWLAGLLSLAVPGGGQLYNHQLLRALLWFLCLGGGGFLILVVYLVAHLGWHIHDELPALGYGLIGLYGLLALIGAADAWRTAGRLRAGNVVVAYSMKRQLALALAGFVPVVGDLAPAVLVPRSELTSRPDPSMRDCLKSLAQQKTTGWLRRLAIRWLVKVSLIGAGVLLLGLTIVIVLLAVLAPELKMK